MQQICPRFSFKNKKWKYSRSNRLNSQNEISQFRVRSSQLISTVTFSFLSVSFFLFSFFFFIQIFKWTIGVNKRQLSISRNWQSQQSDRGEISTSRPIRSEHHATKSTSSSKRETSASCNDPGRSTTVTKWKS